MEYESHSRPWTEYLRFYAGFLSILALTLVGMAAFQIYVKEPQEKKEQQVRVLNWDGDEHYGSTPEEVIGKFLAEVEKGDFREAAKYAVEKERSYVQARLMLSSRGEKLHDMVRRIRSIDFSHMEKVDELTMRINEPIHVEFFEEKEGRWKIYKIDLLN